MGMLINKIDNVLTTTISWSHIKMLPKNKLIAVRISTCVPMIIKEFTPHHIRKVLMCGIFEIMMDKQNIDVIPLAAAPNKTRTLSGRMLFNNISLQLLSCASNTVSTTEIKVTIDIHNVLEFLARLIK